MYFKKPTLVIDCKLMWLRVSGLFPPTWDYNNSESHAIFEDYPAIFRVC